MNTRRKIIPTSRRPDTKSRPSEYESNIISSSKSFLQGLQPAPMKFKSPVKKDDEATNFNVKVGITAKILYILFIILIILSAWVFLDYGVLTTLVILSLISMIIVWPTIGTFKIGDKISLILGIIFGIISVVLLSMPNPLDGYYNLWTSLIVIAYVLSSSYFIFNSKIYGTR